LKARALLALGLLALLGPAACRRDGDEAPLLRVNGEPITLSQLKREMAFMDEAAPSPQDAMDALVDQALVLQEGRRLGVRLTAEDLRSAEALALAGTDFDDFKASLKARGLSYDDWRERLAQAALADQAVQSAVRSRLEVGRQEIQDHYWEHLTAYRSPAKRVLRQVYTRTRSQAEAAERELDLGEPFEAVAKAHGQGPEAAQGGLLGPVASPTLPKALAKAAADLKPGQRSRILASRWGYHILACDSIEPALALSLEAAAPKAHARLLKDKEQDEYRLWLARLREAAVIEKLSPLPQAAGPTPEKGAR
jgi:parvulin-like peptidyl-prolyl isomerase